MACWGTRIRPQRHEQDNGDTNPCQVRRRAQKDELVGGGDIYYYCGDDSKSCCRMVVVVVQYIGVAGCCLLGQEMSATGMSAGDPTPLS